MHTHTIYVMCLVVCLMVLPLSSDFRLVHNHFPRSEHKLHSVGVRQQLPSTQVNGFTLRKSNIEFSVTFHKWFVAIFVFVVLCESNKFILLRETLLWHPFFILYCRRVSFISFYSNNLCLDSTTICVKCAK